MSSTSSELKGSAALLTGANVMCGLIGVSQGLVVLRLLGPEPFGAAAVVVALATVAVNLVDVRLTDLISKLYYDARAGDPDNGTAYRAAVLRLGLKLYSYGGVLITAVAILALSVGAHRFTGLELKVTWLCLAAAAHGLSYLGSFFIFIQRFTVTPTRMAVLQIASAIINAVSMVGFVAATGTIGGYTAGLLASAAGIAVLNAWYTHRVLRQNGTTPFQAPSEVPGVLVDRKLLLRFVAAGNVLGYVKLLHRGADVLLVAAFCGDRETGVYKLARSIADALFAMSEALGRVYQPRLLALLQRRDHAAYVAEARSLMAIAALVTTAAVSVELALLPRFAPFLGVTDARSLTLSVAVLTLSFLFAAGVQSWMWPALVYSERLGRCALWSVFAVLAGQYALGSALFSVAGDGSPIWFCVGYLSFYPLSLVPLWRDLSREWSAFRWRVQEAPAQ